MPPRQVEILARGSVVTVAALEELGE